MADLNKQLQMLEARVQQAEKSIAAHHQGISKIVEGLSSNPLTMDVGAIGQVFYNALPGSFQILLDLIEGGFDGYKSITDGLAAAIADAAGEAVEQAVDQIVEQVEKSIEAQIEAIENMINGYLDQIQAYAQQLYDLKKQIADVTNPKEKAALEAKKAATEKLQQIAITNLAQAQLTADGILGKAVPAVQAKLVAFIKSQKELARGKSQSLDITTSG